VSDHLATLNLPGRLSQLMGKVEHWVARAFDTVRGHHLGRRTGVGLAMIVVTLAGCSLGLLLGGRTHNDVGPFSAVFSVTPSVTGGTDVEIPPLGSLHIRSHDGPAHLTVALQNLDQKRTLALANDPNGLSKLSQHAVVDVERGVTKLVLQAAGAAILGALALSALIFRNMRRVAICGGLAMVTVVTSGVIAVGTFQPTAIEEPSYKGLLRNAPAVVGDARRIAGQFDAYRAELQRLVNNVTKLYSTISALPVYEPDPHTIRVLHVSDLHLNPSAWSVIKTVAQQFDVNVVVDTGDINDWGTPMESSFVDSIGTLKVPYVFIRGNHDSALTAAAVGHQGNAKVLENQVITVDGLTIAGIGDPRFTPDKSTRTPDVVEQSMLTSSGRQLVNTIDEYHHPVDIALVHDPASAQPLAGKVPLVLAGHLHRRADYQLAPPPGASASPVPDGHTPVPPKSTMVMVEGSTGGAGLRGLEGERPTPLEMSVLYFDPQHMLQAYDDITLGGTGQTEVTLQRHVIGAAGTPGPSATASAPESASPSPSQR
jgi:predicted phosphodiesterase